MDILDPSSLGKTLENLNETFFYGNKISASEKKKIATWIASRQGLPHSYRSMFGPLDYDWSSGLKLFTGEEIKTKAGSMHIMGEEASRALILLNVDTPKVKKAMEKARDGMFEAMDLEHRVPGTFCCGICTVAFWRNLSVGGLKNSESELVAGLKDLAKHRTGDGKWRRYPFYYTLLALLEIEHPLAKFEMIYASSACERYVKRYHGYKKYEKRRHDITERVLEEISKKK
jgi:hypothetical protein